MTVIEAARVLGEVVQADERYKEYVKCKEENDKDESLQNLIGEWNRTSPTVRETTKR